MVNTLGYDCVVYQLGNEILLPTEENTKTKIVVV
jgi:hypothetical protein